MKIKSIVQPIRGCGKRKEGGLYLRSAEADKNGVLPLVTVIHPPIPLNRAPHRGPIVISGDALLARQPEDTWLSGASRYRTEAAKGQAWQLETFGMSTALRMKTGVCRGTTSADEALERIISQATLTMKSLDCVRNMSADGVDSLPNMAQPYARMVRGIQAFATSRSASDLVTVVAALWSMAEHAQPRHHRKILPHIARMFTTMGMQDDALSLLMRYNKLNK